MHTKHVEALLQESVILTTRARETQIQLNESVRSNGKQFVCTSEGEIL